MIGLGRWMSISIWGVWLNRQATGHNHIKHLLEKASSLHWVARKAKFWRGVLNAQAKSP